MSDRLKFLLGSLKRELQAGADTESPARAMGIINEIENNMRASDEDQMVAKITAMSSTDIDKIIDETVEDTKEQSGADTDQKSESKNHHGTLCVCVCGGGHGGHAFVATIAGKLKPKYKCNWFSFRGGGKTDNFIKI